MADIREHTIAEVAEALLYHMYNEAHRVAPDGENPPVVNKNLAHALMAYLEYRGVKDYNRDEYMPRPVDPVVSKY
jgi:hypothetical protein